MSFCRASVEHLLTPAQLEVPGSPAHSLLSPGICLSPRRPVLLVESGIWQPWSGCWACALLLVGCLVGRTSAEEVTWRGLHLWMLIPHGAPRAQRQLQCSLSHRARSAVPLSCLPRPSHQREATPWSSSTHLLKPGLHRSL